MDRRIQLDRGEQKRWRAEARTKWLKGLIIGGEGERNPDPLPSLSFCLANSSRASFVNSLLTKATWHRRYGFLLYVFRCCMASGTDTLAQQKLIGIFGRQAEALTGMKFVYAQLSRNRDELIRGWFVPPDDLGNPKLGDANLFFTITSRDMPTHARIVRRLESDLKIEVVDFKHFT